MYSVHCRRSKIKRWMVECESEKESTVVGNGGLEGRACSWVFPAWDLGSLRESQSAVADVPGGGPTLEECREHSFWPIICPISTARQGPGEGRRHRDD